LNGDGNTAAIYVDTFPRTINRYSGGGYTIMERVVEDITGQDFADYMQEVVLKPSGMSRSTYVQPLPVAQQANVSLAFDGNAKVYPGGWYNYPEQAAAGLWTTPSDLARFAIGLQKSVTNDNGPILRQDIVQQMLTQDELGHGLGPAVRGAGDSLIFMHGGKNAGFTCHLLAYARQGKGLVVMSGADGAMPLIREIQMAIAREYGWTIFQPRKIKTIQQSEEVLQARVGTYLLREADYKVYLILRDGELIIVDPNIDNKEYALRSITNSEMIDLIDGDKITFMEDASGVVTGLKQNDYYFLEKIN
jgi:CubicO group peptidase (beta-lactamase class C family)